MKVCMVAEGCYPYVVGGVAGWINSIIRSFPNMEFVLVAIIANRSQSGKFVYDLPDNLTQIYEVYLEDYSWEKKRRKKYKLNKEEYDAVLNMVMNRKSNWDVIFELFNRKQISVDDILMGEDFYHIARICYDQKYPNIIFSDFLWTLRSIYLPFFLMLKAELPKADLYHCVATGYSGVIGSMASYLYGSKLMISEHGIYTREREEEIIKASWVTGVYKDIWIEQFKKMSRVAYDRADIVTSLYEHARELQIELGCPEEKTRVTPNGINTKNLQDIPGKLPEDEGWINIGAVLRVTPIKDVKTMIQAFSYAKKKVPSLKLWIMGGYEEDTVYAEECFQLVESLKLNDVIFTGRINVREYLGRMDFTILTSVSEGQPLTILESYAAHKPVVATDVGNCRGLIYGEQDDFGPAGILTHIMNLEEISQAMVELALDEEGRLLMGEAGYKRVMGFYSIEHMKKTYEKLYREFAEAKQLAWTEEPFVIEKKEPQGGM